MNDEPADRPARASLLNPRGWGIPFKLVLMGACALMLLAGEGLLTTRGVPWACGALGAALVFAEARAPVPSGGSRALFSVALIALLFAHPRDYDSLHWYALGGVLGVALGVLHARATRSG